MSSAPYTSKPVCTPQDAIASHVRWKIALLLATQMREPLSDRALRALHNPGECRVGIWLVSDHTLRLRGTPEYRAAMDLHVAYHGQMKRIAKLIQAAEYAQAEHLLNAPGPYQTISNSLANAVMAFDRIAVPRLPPNKPIQAK